MKDIHKIERELVAAGFLCRGNGGQHQVWRHPRGPDNGGWKYSKIPPASVAAIRAARGDKVKIAEFAKRFDVHPATIRRVARGATLGYV